MGCKYPQVGLPGRFVVNVFVSAHANVEVHHIRMHAPGKVRLIECQRECLSHRRCSVYSVAGKVVITSVHETYLRMATSGAETVGACVLAGALLGFSYDWISEIPVFTIVTSTNRSRVVTDRASITHYSVTIWIVSLLSAINVRSWVEEVSDYIVGL